MSDTLLVGSKVLHVPLELTGTVVKVLGQRVVVKLDNNVTLNASRECLVTQSRGTSSGKSKTQVRKQG